MVKKNNETARKEFSRCAKLNVLDAEITRIKNKEKQAGGVTSE